MTEDAIKAKDLAGEGGAGEIKAGSSEKSPFDALDDIMNIANRATRKTAPAGEGGGQVNGSAAKPNGAARADEGRDRDDAIEQSLSEALDEIMNGAPAPVPPALPSARSAAAPARPGASAAAAAAAARPKAGTFTEKLLYQMLSDLKSDIDALRRESDTTRARALAPKPLPDEASDGEKFMYGLLAELKSDIDALKHETGTVGYNAIGARGNAHEAELYAMLSNLRSDITTLKAESEAFMHHGVGIQPQVYAAPPSTLRPVLIGALTAIAILAAGAGGFFFANQQAATGPEPAPAPVASAPAPLASEPVQTAEPAKPAVSDEGSEMRARTVTTTAVDGGKAMSAEEEDAMLGRAERLLDQGDIVAARMILDYAVSEGSATAAYRLAQTYDPKYLETANLAIEAQPDVTQALTLYYFAARSGNQDAAARMAELKRETGDN
ncbi:MAG TPA: hypothetical protein PLG99_01985 [Kaistiaceae bacterium]|nr:hypothetical protein [Kaistiaceae bacterium]